ncbi:hypothetical protein EAH73_01480 [Hymenobacter nivis]|uniref:Uncharacterized protein n=1 Tax=Hymenobacter nivis TaxID=1850093 RepID=A0A502HFV4_9BACT|nr:hypothetical protein EAH73_01480 [Hymenobacter nivis]
MGSRLAGLVGGQAGLGGLGLGGGLRLGFISFGLGSSFSGGLSFHFGLSFCLRLGFGRGRFRGPYFGFGRGRLGSHRSSFRGH